MFESRDPMLFALFATDRFAAEYKVSINATAPAIMAALLLDPVGWYAPGISTYEARDLVGT